MRRLDLIDTRQGTRNQHTVGHGNTLPYTGVPFGMNHFVLQTRLEDVRFFHPDDYTNYGVRLTHQPSPWMGDFCQILFNQFLVTEEEYQRLMNDASENNIINLAMSSYRPDEAIFQPHYLAYKRLRDGLNHEWVVGERGARWRTTKTRDFYRHLLTVTIDSKANVFLNNHDTLLVETAQLSGSKYYQFQQFSYLMTNAPIKLLKSIEIKLNHQPVQVYIFELIEDCDVFEVNLSTSYISFTQAQINYSQSDFFAKNFKAAIEDSAILWENYLNKIDVKHRDFEKVKTFYHCLWRTATFPQMAYEVNQHNEIIHFSPYTGKVESGHFFTNNGYWDTFRTNYPLYSLIIPSMIPKFLDGILSIVKEDRYLPKWLSPDERGLMPGTLVDAVIADAVVKELVPIEMAEALLEAMIDSANHAGEHLSEGREGVEEFLRLGYLSTNYHESVNKTLDFSYSDFCIGQVAAYLGKKEIVEKYRKRSYAYRNLYDFKTGHMIPKNIDGTFISTFIDYRWGEHYTEGSAWQNSLAVYHNIQDLIALHGGDESFFEYLQYLVNQEAIYDVNGYGYEIHEMTEMAKIPFGQLALSNQPSFHIPYLFIYAGYPHFSQLLIKELVTHLFDSSVTGFIGDEDNGSLSSWYVLSSLGIYPVTPGSGEWTLGITTWDLAIVHLENGNDIELISKDLHTPYLKIVKERWINGQKYLHQSIKHQALLEGLTMEQSLGIVPSIDKIANEYRPYSLENQ